MEMLYLVLRKVEAIWIELIGKGILESIRD